MTTSMLRTFTPGHLNGNDLQALKDFALEAPYEWRMAFEQLLEAAVQADLLDELQGDFDCLRDRACSTAKQVADFVESIETKSASGKLTKGDLVTLCSSIRAELNILTEEATRKDS